jgi:protoheme IX farnesyltransferase
MKTKLSLYYQLAKPGIIYGNLMTAAAAFSFAVHHLPRAPFNFGLLFATLIGLGLSMAAGCVANNVMERDIDARMERTKTRALPQGHISIRNAILYACALGVVGVSVLYLFTNTYALLVTIFGMVVYIGLYTPAKQITAHSTIVGAFAGAVPPVVGYVAVSNAIDLSALLLFLILVCWQMPHFFAIALYRSDDYHNAGLPVMPSRIGRVPTQALMTVYTILFAAATFIFGMANQLSLLYTIPMCVVAFGWMAFALSGFKTKKPEHWARKMFFYSLIALVLFSALIAFV